MISVVVAGLASGLAAWSFGPQLLSIYITDSEEAISYGMLRLTYICIPYFLCGLMEVSTGVLRGLGASLVPMIISVVGACGLRIVWIYTIFQVFHTPQCLYSSYIVSWTVTFLAQLIALIVVYKKHIRAYSAYR